LILSATADEKLTGLATPHDLPSAALLGTKTYGTFCSQYTASAGTKHLAFLPYAQPVAGTSAFGTQVSIDPDVCFALALLQASSVSILWPRSAHKRQCLSCPMKTWLFPELTLSSARRGRCSKISMGSASAAITTNSQMPLFRVLVAASAATPSEWVEGSCELQQWLSIESVWRI